MRLSRTEHGNHPGQCSVSAGPHVHGLGGEPDGVDTNHWARPRIKHAQPSGSEAGHFTVTDLSPRASEMIAVSSVARLGAACMGMKVADHVGVDAVMDGYAGNRRSRLQAFLDDLGFE